MSRMNKRIGTVVLLIAAFGSVGSVVTAAPASAAFKPDICGDFCK